MTAPEDDLLWSAAARRDELQLQFDFGPSVPGAPSWEGLPAGQRAAVVVALARLFAKAGFLAEQHLSLIHI